MASATKLRVGVIGLGKMGKLHLQKYLQNSNVIVSGIYDTNWATASQLSETYQIKAYRDLDELLFDSDAVTVATPTDTHYRITRKALESSVHVLVEKPISHEVAEAEHLVSLAREKNIILQVGFVERFRFRVLSQSLLPSNVLFIESDRLTQSPGRETEIDVVSDLMIHDLDLALSLVGQEPDYVSAIGLPIITNLCDMANARLEFPNGAVVNLNASRVSDKPMRKFRVFSANSYASIDFMTNSVDIAQRDGSAVISHLNLGYSDLDALRDQNLQFVECVSHGIQPLVSGEDGLRALKVAKMVKAKISEREQRSNSQLAGIKNWSDLSKGLSDSQ